MEDTAVESSIVNEVVESTSQKSDSTVYDELHFVSEDVQHIESHPSQSKLKSALASVIFGETVVEDEQPAEENVERQDSLILGKKPEESREAKRARLKNARNIRFVVDEPSEANVNLVGYEIREDSTAISTPTRLTLASAQVEDIVNNTEHSQEEETETPNGTDNDEAAIDEIINLDHRDNETDDDQDDYLATQSQKIDTVQAKHVFLNDFEIPSISDISEDVDEYSLRFINSKESTTSSHHHLSDKGKFVNPLTGQSMSSSTTTSSSSSAETTASESDSLQLEPLDEQERLQNEFNELAEFKTVVVVAADDEDVFVKFTKELSEPKMIFDDNEEERRTQLKQAMHITLEFIYDLINAVVKEAEQHQEDNRLKRLLDKRKLINGLIKERDSYIYERELNNFLNLRMVDYYKRARNTRPFAELSGAMANKEFTRYREALHAFDHYSNVAAKTKTKSSYLLSSVMVDISYIENIARQTEEHLEQVIFGVLGKRSDHLLRVTERELRLMKEKRNEISDARLFLITRKHTLGKIREKLKTLEKINDDLVMDDFISIQNQVTAVTKKIEERNVDLKKLRNTYHAALHIAQHNRERTIALSGKLREHIVKLNKKLEIQRCLRESLYNAKMERARLRKRHSDLTYQGGLLAMPALMLDYDETVEKVKTKQAAVQEMKETLAKLTQRIADYQTRCL